MIIGDRFVVLHPPKTGGSFLTEVIINIIGRSGDDRLTQHEKHGAFGEIPEEHRAKQIVATVRNPFDYYASQYKFGYWINRDDDPTNHWDVEKMRCRFPSYPNLSFEQYIDGTLESTYSNNNDRLAEIKNQLGLGPLTVTMLRYSVADPVEFLEPLLLKRDTRMLKQQVGRIRFLHTESLNRETYQWFLELGVPPEVAEPVLSKPRVQPLNTPDGVALPNGAGQPRDLHWLHYFTERSREAVIRREWLFFELFPEYAWLLQEIGRQG